MRILTLTPFASELYDVEGNIPSRISRIERSGKAFLNGIKNSLEEAFANGETFAGSSYTMIFNPTSSFLHDGIETFQDTFLGGSKASRQLRSLLSDASSRGLNIELFAHSQGGAIAASALAAGAVDGISVQYRGAPISEGFARSSGSFGSWRAHGNDAVSMILGGNGNFGQILRSLGSAINLFRSGCASPHSASSYAGICP